MGEIYQVLKQDLFNDMDEILQNEEKWLKSWKNILGNS